MQAFRLQLALEAGQGRAGQGSPSGPCILDQRLHTKPHHQPILFVDDSQAPNLQLPAKPRSHLQHRQIAASPAAVAGASYPNSNDSDVETPPHGVPRGSRVLRTPGEKLASSCDEAESISSSPRAKPLRLMQQLMAHGRGLSHTPKHVGPAREADSLSRINSDAELLRQASSNSSASSSSHMRVAGPSHGSDSRFAAMKSLTRSAMSPRHAISLDSPAKLAATRNQCTLAHNLQPSHMPGAHALSSAGCNFDMDINSLSPASSFGDSAGSSSMEGPQRRPSGRLAHLVSAPEAGSFADALAAAASYGGSVLSPNSFASPSAPLLAAAALDSSAADSADPAPTSTTSHEPAANGASALPTALHSSTDQSAVQNAGKAQHALHDPQDGSQGTPPQGSISDQHAEAGSHQVDLPVALSGGGSMQLQQLPISQDSLDFSLDLAYAPGLAAGASDSQQLMLSNSFTSTSLLGDEQAGLQRIGCPSSSLLVDKQTMPQDCSSQVTHRLLQQPLQQLGRSFASSESSQPLDQHDPGPFSELQDQQLAHDLMPAVSSVMQTQDASADQLTEQSLLQWNVASAPASQDEQQPLLSLLDPEPLRAAGLMAIGNADGKDPQPLPITKGNADGASIPSLPTAPGNLDAHKSAGCPGERQQVGSLLASLFSDVSTDSSSLQQLQFLNSSFASRCLTPFKAKLKFDSNIGEQGFEELAMLQMPCTTYDSEALPTLPAVEAHAERHAGMVEFRQHTELGHWLVSVQYLRFLCLHALMLAPHNHTTIIARHEQSFRLMETVLLQGVARVLSKLPSLQSMTQRLRSHSQRVLQPVAQHQQQHPATVDEAEEDQASQASGQHDTEAHVMVFVHGFRVRDTSLLPRSSCSYCVRVISHIQ